MIYLDVLKFWFEDIDPSKWWIKDAEFDQLLKEKFLDIHIAANNCELYQWRKTAEGRLYQTHQISDQPCWLKSTLSAL